MKGLEIYQRIQENNKRVQDAMQFNVFVLNNTVSELLAENRELQAQCEHEYEEGVCIYCMKLSDEE